METSNATARSLVKLFLTITVTWKLLLELTEKAAIPHAATPFMIMASIVQDGAEEEPGTNE